MKKRILIILLTFLSMYLVSSSVLARGEEKYKTIIDAKLSSKISDLGYYLQDLNNDGVMELFIGPKGSDEIYEIWTIYNDNLNLVKTGSSKYEYPKLQLVENNVVLYIDSGFLREHQYSTFDGVKLNHFLDMAWTGEPGKFRIWSSEFGNGLMDYETYQKKLAEYPVVNIPYKDLSEFNYGSSNNSSNSNSSGNANSSNNSSSSNSGNNETKKYLTYKFLLVDKNGSPLAKASIDGPKDNVYITRQYTDSKGYATLRIEEKTPKDLKLYFSDYGNSLSAQRTIADLYTEVINKITLTGSEIYNDWENPTETAVTVYRLYNEVSKEHIYTADENEVKNLTVPGLFSRLTGKDSTDWKDEGVAWYAPLEGKPVYRLYNKKSGHHLYTVDSNERETLILSGDWQSDNNGNAMFLSGGNFSIYRLHNNGAHLLTADKNEYNHLQASGWDAEGIKLKAKSTDSTSIAVNPDDEAIEIKDTEKHKDYKKNMDAALKDLGDLDLSDIAGNTASPFFISNIDGMTKSEKMAVIKAAAIWKVLINSEINSSFTKLKINEAALKIGVKVNGKDREGYLVHTSYKGAGDSTFGWTSFVLTYPDGDTRSFLINMNASGSLDKFGKQMKQYLTKAFISDYLSWVGKTNIKGNLTWKENSEVIKQFLNKAYDITSGNGSAKDEYELIGKISKYVTIKEVGTASSWSLDYKSW